MQGRFSVVYIAKVRVTVRAGGQIVYRDGQGTGESQGATLGEAHDKALKTAETDATKRALATFGRPFGLGLYLPTSRTKSAYERPKEPIVDTAPRPKEGSAAIEAPAPKQQDVGAASALNCTQTLAPTSAGTDLQSGVEPQRGAVTGEHNEVENGFAAAGEKTVVSFGFARRLRDKTHLQHVRRQSCLICGGQSSDAHHLTFAQSRAMGRKVSDEFTVPLCRNHHRKLHHFGSELAWWQAMKIDPVPVAQKLWEESRDHRAVVEGPRLS